MCFHCVWNVCLCRQVLCARCRACQAWCADGFRYLCFVVRRMKKRKRRVWKRTFSDSSVLWERVEVERIRPPAMWVIAPRLPRVGWRDVLSAGLRWHWHPQVLEWYIANSIGKDKRFCSRTHVPAYAGERLLSCGIIFMCPKCACARVCSSRPVARIVC